MDLIKIFATIFLAVFLGTSIANWKGDVHYKVDFVSATSTEGYADYLNRQGKAGWDLYNYREYSDGRQYLFRK